MDNAEEIRGNRDKIRTDLKLKLTSNKKLCANRFAEGIGMKNQAAEGEGENNMRIRRKTSMDIRQVDNCFDMFECSEILISSDFESLYDVVGKIDEGSQSVIYLCKEKQSEKLYAVKNRRTRDFDLQKLEKQQFRILKNLDHENIIKAYNLFMNERVGVSYLITEYCEYPNLRVFLNKQRTSSENETAQIINILLKTASYIHGKGICHRDIKPDNILYDPQTGNLKLIDFQISKMVKYEHQRLDMWTNTGTLQYKAPEMFKGSYTSLVDIWAIGVVCYELLTGELPFYNLFANQTIRQIIQDEPKYDFPFLTDCCVNFLKKCLHKDPLKRFDAFEALKSPFMLKYSSMSSCSSPKHRKNGSDGGRKCSYEIQIMKCYNEDSELTNRDSLNLDGGIRLITDFSKGQSN